MDFRLVKPPDDLARWVDSIWASTGHLDQCGETVLPNGSTEIVANLGAPMRLEQLGRRQSIRGTTVSGLSTKPFHLEHPQVHTAVGLRLTPLGLRGLLGLPAAALLDDCVSLEDATTISDELSQICDDASGLSGKIEAAIRWARERVRRMGHEPDPLVAWAVIQIERSGGALSITDLQHHSSFGATRFTARFRNELGITPKRFARLVRFRRALDGLTPNRSLASLAAELGFADQAHLNAEFRSLAHTTPSRVLQQRYPTGHSLADADYV